MKRILTPIEKRGSLKDHEVVRSRCKRTPSTASQFKMELRKLDCCINYNLQKRDMKQEFWVGVGF